MMFTVVRSINGSIPIDAQCPLKCGDNLTTHVTHSSEALGHGLARLTIDLNFFQRSNSIAKSNGKGKGGEKVDTSPMECSISYPSKGGRDKEILQSKGGIRVSTSQGKMSTNKGLDYLDEDRVGLEAI